MLEALMPFHEKPAVTHAGSRFEIPFRYSRKGLADAVVVTHPIGGKGLRVFVFTVPNVP